MTLADRPAQDDSRFRNGSSACGSGALPVRSCRRRVSIFDSAARLSEADLCRLGLSAGDSHKLVLAIASQDVSARAISGRGHHNFGDTSKTNSDFLDASGASSSPSCSAIWWVIAVCLSASIPRNCATWSVAFRQRVHGKAVSHYDGHVSRGPRGTPWSSISAGRRRTRTRPSAVCARALEIVEAVKNVRAIEPLAAHIGIATGEVVVGGAPGAGGGGIGLTYGAYGESLNLAARLQGTAESPRDPHRAHHPAPRGRCL